MTCTIHQAAKKRFGDQVCSMCGVVLNAANQPGFTPGELVGVIEGKFTRTSYRIGEHNQDPMCDGRKASEFYQKSVTR